MSIEYRLIFQEQFFWYYLVMYNPSPNSNQHCLFKETGSLFDNFFFTYADSTWWISNGVYLQFPQKRGP